MIPHYSECMNVVTITHQQMALLTAHHITVYLTNLFPFLTLCHSQHLCNPQWQGGVYGDALNC